MRNAMDAQEMAVGWWPGDCRHGNAAFYAYAHPAVAGFDAVALGPDGTHWDSALGEYVLAWDDVRVGRGPAGRRRGVRALGVPARGDVCGWDETLAATADPTSCCRSGDGAVTLSSPLPELRAGG